MSTEIDIHEHLLDHDKRFSKLRSAGSQCTTMDPTLRATLFLLVYLTMGSLCFLNVKDEFNGKATVSFVDVLYFCVVTMTTVGYGDLVPATDSGKLFTCLFVFVGFALVGLILGSAANYLVDKQERLLERALNREELYADKSKIKRVHWKAGIAGVLVLILFAVGILLFMYSEGLSFVDSLYSVCVTVTTLGYGDHSFSTAKGRLLAVVWILLSTVCVAQFFLYVAEMRAEGRQHAIAQWVLSRKINYNDFQAADLDANGLVSPTEFIVFKLKEMGKIDQDDITEILKEFQELDVDNSGNISISDMKSV